MVAEEGDMHARCHGTRTICRIRVFAHFVICIVEIEQGRARAVGSVELLEGYAWCSTT